MIDRLDHYDGVRRDIFRSLQDYAAYGCPTGSFLHAVLTNDLFDACGRADDNNERALPDICRLIYNHLPSDCWGSEKIVAGWLHMHRELREQARADGSR